MNRLGFHYYPDTNHYRQCDLAAWLPKLKQLGANWLILNAPSERAIPEHFIGGLIEAGIEPVLQFRFIPDQAPSHEDLQLLLRTYVRWGVQYVVLFDRPNLKRSWQSTAWAQTNLVERFLDIYLPLAEACLQTGLLPIFPPLEPGGDYWDTAFLRASLQGIQRRGHTRLLEKLVIGAYAWAGDRPLDWGAGGPECWPGAHPYFTPKGEQDQRGFRIFDWYDALIRSVLVSPLPIFLFGVGCPLGEDPEIKTHTRKNWIMAQLLRGDSTQQGGSIRQMDPIPDAVIGGAFWLVAESQDDQQALGTWFRPDGEALPIVKAIQKWTGKPPNGKSSPQTESRLLSHYLLIPSFEWGISDFHFDLIRPFVKEHQPTIGFSIEEAIQAKRITVVGGPDIFPEEKANQLRSAGCIVDRLSTESAEMA
jgi:hypothetical protein